MAYLINQSKEEDHEIKRVIYGVSAQTISRPVAPQDIAATIAAYLEIKPPSGSVGVPLVEVLKE
jgi:hypothetical protein